MLTIENLNMKVPNVDNELVELNVNETAVYMCFVTNGDECEESWNLHPSDVFANGLSDNQVKGYLSALDKKGVIWNDISAWSTVGTIEELRELGIE